MSSRLSGRYQMFHVSPIRLTRKVRSSGDPATDATPTMVVCPPLVLLAWTERPTPRSMSTVTQSPGLFSNDRPTVWPSSPGSREKITSITKSSSSTARPIRGRSSSPQASCSVPAGTSIINDPSTSAMTAESASVGTHAGDSTSSEKPSVTKLDPLGGSSGCDGPNAATTSVWVAVALRHTSAPTATQSRSDQQYGDRRRRRSSLSTTPRSHHLPQRRAVRGTATVDPVSERPPVRGRGR